MILLKLKCTMKRPLFLLSLGLIAWMLIITGCAKNSYSSNTTYDTTNMTFLTQQAWIYDTAGIGSPPNPDTIAAALPLGVITPCQTDDTLYFNTNGTGTENQGPIACTPPVQQSTSFQWSFNAQQNMITSSDSLFTGFGGAITITSLNATQLHLLKTVTVAGFPVTIDIYLKHP
jgi:hypothetical protein